MKIFFSFFILTHFFSISFAQLFVQAPADDISRGRDRNFLAPSAIARNSSGMIIGAWSEASSVNHGPDAIVFRKSFDEGITWEDVKVLELSSIAPTLCRNVPLTLLLNDNDTIFLVFERIMALNGQPLLSLGISPDAGTTWNPFLNLENFGAFDAALGLTQPVLVVEAFTGTHHVITAIFPGYPTSHFYRISDDSFNSFEPKVAINRLDQITAVFTTDKGTIKVVSEAHWNGSNWSDPQNISNSLLFPCSPCVDINNNSNVRAVWAEKDANENVIIQSAFTYHIEQPWNNPVNIATQPPGEINQISVAINQQMGVTAWHITSAMPQTEGFPSKPQFRAASFTNSDFDGLISDLLPLGEGALEHRLYLTEENVASLIFRKYDFLNSGDPSFDLGSEDFFGTVSLLVSPNAGKSWLEPIEDLSLRQRGISAPAMAANRATMLITWNQLQNETSVQQKFLSVEELTSFLPGN